MIHGDENRNTYLLLVGKLGRNGRLENLGLDGGVISIPFPLSTTNKMRRYIIFFTAVIALQLTYASGSNRQA
jgi:hypothetical protein